MFLDGSRANLLLKGFCYGNEASWERIIRKENNSVRCNGKLRLEGFELNYIQCKLRNNSAVCTEAIIFLCTIFSA